MRSQETRKVKFTPPQPLSPIFYLIHFVLLLLLSGFYLAVGFVSGAVKLLDPCTLAEEAEGSFEHTHDCITHLTFSHNSSYLAAAVSAPATILEKPDTLNPFLFFRTVYIMLCYIICVWYFIFLAQLVVVTSNKICNTHLIDILHKKIKRNKACFYSRTVGKLLWCFMYVRKALSISGSTLGSIALTTSLFKTCCSGCTWTALSHVCCPWAWIAD